MKKFFSIALFGMSCVLALAGNPPPAPSLFVNGIFTIFGDRRVIFKIYPAGGGENSAILAEGETYDGIHLLSVDIKMGVAHFDNHGLLQNIPICGTPDLNVASAQTSGFAVNGRSHFNQTAPAVGTDQGTLGSSDFNRAGFGLVGGPSGFIAPKKSGEKAADKSSPTGQPQNNDISGQSPSSDYVDNDDSSQLNGGPVTAAIDKTNPDASTWWYQASQETETARQATAAAVLRGDAQPYPLTPLTPTGTDSRLVNTNAVYFNHYQRQF